MALFPVLTGDAGSGAPSVAGAAGVFQTEVDLDGLLSILGEHLYSTPHVVLRELVQNAHDSCVRRRLESAEAVDPVIRVTVDPAERTLSIEDDGSGMTAEEIRRYLATVGVGYTASLRRETGGADLIGCFGLGFLSAFLVSERIEVHTCSYREPDRAWLFSSRGARSYAIREGAPRPVGTRVRLHLSPRFAELAQPSVVGDLLRRYCALLPMPVRLGQALLNGEPPPWRSAEHAPEVRRRMLDASFARRFDPRHEALFCVRVDSEGPCRGIVWAQDESQYGCLDQRRVWAYVRGMMVTDSDRDLLPAWAGFCCAVVESDALRPTASRESLQHEAVYDHAQRQIHDALVAGLVDVALNNPAAWKRLLRRKNQWLLGAAIADPKLFELLHPELTVPTSAGDLTVSEVRDRSSGAIHVSLTNRSGFEELLCRALGLPVVDGSRHGAQRFCALYAERVGGRLVKLGTDEGNRALFRPAAADDARDALLRAWLGAPRVDVVASHYAPEHLPLVLVPDREVELKRWIESDEADKRIAAGALRLARLYTARIDDHAVARLYVNLDCPAVGALFVASERSRARGLALLRTLVAVSGEGSSGPGYLGMEDSLRLFCSTVQQILED